MKIVIPKMKLINWMPGRGSPYSYGANGVIYTSPKITWKILPGKLCNGKSGKAHKHALPGGGARGKPIRSIDLDLHLRTLAGVKPEVAETLVVGAETARGPYKRRSSIAFVRWLDGDGRSSPPKRRRKYGRMTRMLPASPRTFKAVLDYLFQKAVVVTIPPFQRRFKSGGRARQQQTVGHIASMIARSYAEVYRTKWREVGVWGHGFNDLTLEGLNIYEGGWIEPLVGS